VYKRQTLESFLPGVLDSIDNSAVVTELLDVDGLTLLAYRSGGVWEHNHDHDHEDHKDRDDYDHAHHEDHDHDHAHDDDHKDHDEHAHDEDHAHHDDHDHHDEHALDEHDGHDHGTHDHDHGEGSTDPHIWLDPANGAAMAAAIAEVLIRIDPEAEELYRENLARLQADLSLQQTALAERLAPLIGSPFVLFHDACHYF